MQNKAKKTTRVDIITAAAVDKDGKLTFSGLNSADRRRTELGSLVYGQVFAGSRAAIVTAHQIAGEQGKQVDTSRIVTCNQLCVTDHLAEAAKQIGGDFTLAKLLRTKDALVKQFGNIALRVMQSAISHDTRNVLIVADPLAVLALAYVWCNHRPVYQQTIAKARLGQCEGFTLSLNEGLHVTGMELELLGQKAL